MILEFINRYDYYNSVQIKVKEKPTQEQYIKIDNFISSKIEYANENGENITDELFYDICYYAVSNVLTVVHDEIIKTFYY